MPQRRPAVVGFTFAAALALILGAAGQLSAPALAQSDPPRAGSVPANPLDAVVGLHATIAPDGRTAETLGRERAGNGIVIDDDLVLTIGYLVMEATGVEILLPDGRRLPADVVAYDYDSGFGLVRSLIDLDRPAIALGNSDALESGSEVLVAGLEGLLPARVASRREFAGYWEYLLPDAIFTTPPFSGFGGAALIGPKGELLGVGSLVVGDAAGDGEAEPGNMFVPINALHPILEDLRTFGRARGPAKPWLGVYAQEVRGHLLVGRVAPEGPAAAAGVQPNDLIVSVDREPVEGLADFYRKVWSLGEAGTEVPLTVARPGRTVDLSVKSGDRYRYLRLSPTY